jgi:hypothetical protein
MVWIKENLVAQAKLKGMVNIVFNKSVGSLKNIVTSSIRETSLTKRRSGFEPMRSNVKGGFMAGQGPF